MLDLDILRLIFDQFVDTDATEDLKACCLSAKVFTPFCQKRIFHTVTLQSFRYYIENTKAPWLDRSKLFVQAIATSPHLAAYVKKLVYRPEVRTDDGLRGDGVAFALEQMSGVFDFKLEVLEEDKAAEFFTDRCPMRLQKAILSIVRNPQLRAVSLRFVQFPLGVLLECIGLDDLEIHSSTLLEMEAMHDAPPLHVKNFTIGGGSLGVFDSDSIRKLFIDLNKVEILKLDVPSLQDYTLAGHLLGQTGSLRDLRIRTYAHVDVDEDTPEQLLNFLNPSSFSTLTSLTVQLFINIEFAISIEDPYFGLFNEAVSKLTAMEDLTLRMLFHGDILLPKSSFESQWRRLDDVLLVPGSESDAFSDYKLKSVNIVATVFGWPVYDEDFYKGASKIVKRILDVRDKQFPRLDRAAEQGFLQFSFNAEVDGWQDSHLNVDVDIDEDDFDADVNFDIIQ